MAPILDYSAAREAMVDSQLRPQGVNDPAVIDAMRTVPRERFVPEGQGPLAYADRSIDIGGGRRMSSPAVVGLLLTGLAPRTGERALVLGCGRGYAAAVLAEMGLAVIALESSAELAAAARAAGLAVVEGSLEQGYKRSAPYDLILIDGAVEHVPDALVDQVADGGRLGTALLDGGVSRLVIGTKAAGSIGYHSIGDAGVAELPGFRRPRAFTF